MIGLSRVALPSLSAACLLVLPIPAHAVLVVGTFTTQGGDVATTPGQPFRPPPPLIDPTTGMLGIPATVGQFTYDTDAVASQSRSPDGLVGRYTFVDSASLSLTIFGRTYSTTSSPANPIEIDVTATPGNAFFRIFSVLGVADASNPFPAYPELEYVNGTGLSPFASADLPTATFSVAGFMDRVAFLHSVALRGTPDWYQANFFASGPTITTVPEPGLPSLLWLAAITWLCRRQRDAVRRSDAVP